MSFIPEALDEYEARRIIYAEKSPVWTCVSSFVSKDAIEASSRIHCAGGGSMKMCVGA